MTVAASTFGNIFPGLPVAYFGNLHQSTLEPLGNCHAFSADADGCNRVDAFEMLCFSLECPVPGFGGTAGSVVLKAIIPPMTRKTW